ncbi:MAG: purine-binding chemotaxis protein CheW [Ectothiorhodospiraceae bacterium]|nr:purine-binding chemotaxis protein CheW [Ectothiorhodospiraceae bacterium]
MTNRHSGMDADDPQTQWLTFTLGKETYGIEVLHVQEVFRCPEISPVPGAPATVLGIINLRGEVITVNDIRAMLGLPEVAVTDQTRIVLLEFDGQKLGMLVDSVDEIMTNKTSEMETTVMSVQGNPFIQATCQKKDKLYILLSTHELLKDDEIS